MNVIVEHAGGELRGLTVPGKTGHAQIFSGDHGFAGTAYYRPTQVAISRKQLGFQGFGRILDVCGVENKDLLSK